ncbi:hypothetical protein EJ110_NYTH12113 [Nymphaea thermarum]|nr:hypothetical protein EJ110_NYTH12113 [Nymphaea thermarum]
MPASRRQVHLLASMVEAKYSMVKAWSELLKPQPLERPPPSTVLAPLSMPTNATAEWDQSRLTFTTPMQGEQSVEDLLLHCGA